MASSFQDTQRVGTSPDTPTRIRTVSTPEVDVIIAVHTVTRPIHRAAASALRGNEARVRVNVVAHNIDPDLIAANLGDLLDDERVRLLPFADGIPSPAGPMNHALDQATAPYFALLGSDDEFAPGALDSWLDLARSVDASMVLARIDRLTSGPDPTPPTRRGRITDLDPARDRLSYRSAPLGLVSRKQFPDLRFTEGLFSGEDLEFTAALWFTGSAFAYDRHTPGYVGHEDEGDRVTSAPRLVREDFAFLDAITTSAWFPRLTRSQRTALGVKTLRVHFFDAVLNRLDAPGDFESTRVALLEVLGTLTTVFPGAVAYLARCDRKVIDALRRGPVDTAEVRRLIGARWGGGADALLTRNPLRSLHAQAPFRTLRAMTV